ncbi:AAA family ATPase [Haloarchaeobius iranensis]|uniref:AAA family ATPase n=1 Tax=Haloarchaeobius iranensis TaxID=996166 RepID=UPI0015874D07|nr:AAA family ATPase [Haloarchaeobius iranensis]
MEGNCFRVELEGFVRTDRLEGDRDAFVFVLEVTNSTDQILQWWYDESVFIDDEGYQHPPSELTYGGYGDPDLEVEGDLRTKPEIVPDARVRCVTDVQIPAGREPARIHYQYGDAEYELDLQDADVGDLELDPAAIGLSTPTKPGDEESDETDSTTENSEADPTASSENFEVTLTNIITDIPEKEIMLLTFDVENIGHQTTQWWYDEHTFVDTQGYQHTEVGTVSGGFITDADVSIEGYKPKPEIQPGATSRCVTDVALDPDERLERVFYDYSGETYGIEIGGDLWERLTVSYEEFDQDKVTVGETDEDSDIDDRITAMVVDDSPDTCFDDIGGLDDQKRKVREAVRDPLIDPGQFEEIGITPPDGVLLYGPPGTGKTMLARAVANDTGATFIKLAGPELARAYLGEGAELVRDCFEYARRQRPAIIFIDEIDAIAAKRAAGANEGTEEIYRTMLQLLSEMDGFEEQSDVRVMAATNRINRLDDAILRPGRFDRKIEVPLPGLEARREIFRARMDDLVTTDDIDLNGLAERSSDLSGADIAAVCTEAGYAALRSGRTEIQQVDFLTALEEINQQVRSDDESLGQQ